jgi:hypothetical protein
MTARSAACAANALLACVVEDSDLAGRWRWRSARRSGEVDYFRADFRGGVLDYAQDYGQGFDGGLGTTCQGEQAGKHAWDFIGGHILLFVVLCFGFWLPSVAARKGGFRTRRNDTDPRPAGNGPPQDRSPKLFTICRRILYPWAFHVG